VDERKTSAVGDSVKWFFAVGEIKLRPMGRNANQHGIPYYREVLVANAVGAQRGNRPAVPVFASAAERRAWLEAAAAANGWRAVAVAAGAIPDHAVLR